MTKKFDLTNKKDADLVSELHKLREEVRSIHASLGADTARIKERRHARKNIARIQTELNTRARQMSQNA